MTELFFVCPKEMEDRRGRMERFLSTLNMTLFFASTNFRKK